MADEPAIVTIHHRGNMEMARTCQSGSHQQFGWTTFDAVELPYVIRNDSTVLLAVHLIEKYILCHYPSTYPEAIQNKPPLVSYLLMKQEADLLTQLCHEGLNAPEIIKPSDPAVHLFQFQEFFRIVKDAYPQIRISYKRPDDPMISHGWILVKDSMVPYVIRCKTCLLPLNVLRGAPQVLVDTPVETTTASIAEIDCLNKLCKKVGLVFMFHKKTELVDLCDLATLCPGCRIEELENDDPLLMLRKLRHNGQQSDQTTKNDTDENQINTQAGSVEVDETPNKKLELVDQSINTPVAMASLAQSKSVEASTESSPHTVSHELKTSTTNPPQSHLLDDMVPPPLIPLDTIIALPGPVLPSSSAGSHIPSLTNGSMNVDLPKHLAQRNRGHIDAKTLIKTTEISKASPTDQVLHREFVNSSQPQLVVTSPEPDVSILPIDCFGKTISCIIRGKQRSKFALVEAIVIVFFPKSDLREFIRYLEFELSVALHTLRKHEESAFIQFYGIPTNQLRCNQIIKLKDFFHRLTWLQQHFGAIDLSHQMTGEVMIPPGNLVTTYDGGMQPGTIPPVSSASLPTFDVIQPNGAYNQRVDGVNVQHCKSIDDKLPVEGHQMNKPQFPSIPMLRNDAMGVVDPQILMGGAGELVQLPIGVDRRTGPNSRGKASLDDMVSRLHGHNHYQNIGQPPYLGQNIGQPPYLVHQVAAGQDASPPTELATFRPDESAVKKRPFTPHKTGSRRKSLIRHVKEAILH